MIMDIAKKIEEHYRIKLYRINYILTLLNNADREASILLENECCKHTAAMSDVCVAYNIIDAGRKNPARSFQHQRLSAWLIYACRTKRLRVFRRWNYRSESLQIFSAWKSHGKKWT